MTGRPRAPLWLALTLTLQPVLARVDAA